MLAKVRSVKKFELHVQKLQVHVGHASGLTRPIQSKEGDVGWFLCSQMLHEQPQMSPHSLHLVLEGLDTLVHALHLRDDVDPRDVVDVQRYDRNLAVHGYPSMCPRRRS